MSEDRKYEPPYKMENGDYKLGNWQPYRKAINSSLQLLFDAEPDNAGKTFDETGAIPKRDWNFACMAIDRFLFDQSYKCNGEKCNNYVSIHNIIRCYDCRGAYCGDCAYRHFWPNGRPRATRIR